MAPGGIRDKWTQLQARFGKGRVENVAIILLIGLASLTVRILIHYDFDSSALLYVGIPYLISLAISLIRPAARNQSRLDQYLDHSMTALTVFLASSIVLFEGFVCVLFFMPIYFIGVSITFFVHSFFGSDEGGGSSTFVHVFPLLVAAASLEGTTESLSVERLSHAEVSKTTSLNIGQIKSNIAQPFDLQKDRHWLISIFPMPYRIDAGSLNAGDVHRVYTQYDRWFWTNTHHGELQLQIAEVEENRIRTRILHDTTFFSTYLTTLGTEITFTEIGPESTRVTLRIDYRRNLDPAWYFHPLQTYAVSRMAEFLIDEVMIRDQN